MILDIIKKAGLDNMLNKKTEDKNTSSSVSNILNFEVEENGKNLSSGEKQLVCIIRAILRQNRVIILDEATANIDLITE